MNLHAEVKELIQQLGTSKMASTAYDTAWVSHLVGLDEAIGRKALDWLRENQLPDGSWGAEQPLYYHDRLICTLAAMYALSKWGDRQDKSRIERARLSMDIAMKGLRADPTGETIGFEMIAPTLLAELKASGVIQRYDDDKFLRIVYPGAKYLAKSMVEEERTRRRDDEYFKRLVHNRSIKIKSLPEGQINRDVTLAFSAEMAGSDRIQLLDFDNIQEPNGSVGYSPSATAYFALYGHRGNPDALNYLREIAKRNQIYYGGGIPDVAPFDTFEISWSLWNLALTNQLDDELLDLCEPKLNFLERVWAPKLGVGFTSGYEPRDSDVTSLTFETLSRYGRSLDLDAVLHYEEDGYFRCYELEANPSVSANIHVLGALREAGFDANHDSVQKVVNFLRQRKYVDMFWADKWHASPYYATSHAIIVSVGYVNDLVDKAIKWIIETQNTNGSWGFYAPTAEETAYCLQALIKWQHHFGGISDDVIERGLDWLLNHKDPPYQPLWIGKCLYTPELVIRSAIISALMLGK